MGFSFPVLTYHSSNISGNSYSTNDHVALAADLDILADAGWAILPLSELVERSVLGKDGQPAKTVALSFDDGTDFDYFDLPHPTHGPQRSMLNILRDHLQVSGKTQRLHATSFVVVSPEARSELDRTSMIGAKWWNDHWWQPAVASRMLGIASHSWDHNHDAISWPAPDGRARGTFASIDTFRAAEDEVARAADFLRRAVPNAAANLFAYPYGESNRYLVEEYFPLYHERIGVRAAFLSKGEPITEASDRWRLPRYTCGEHWKSPDELRALLRDIAA
jgi:peptidoglycan/xylan/chitin deacetylase (PgdA/CDA1 family)